MERSLEFHAQLRSTQLTFGNGHYLYHLPYFCPPKMPLALFSSVCYLWKGKSYLTAFISMFTQFVLFILIQHVGEVIGLYDKQSMRIKHFISEVHDVHSPAWRWPPSDFWHSCWLLWSCLIFKFTGEFEKQIFFLFECDDSNLAFWFALDVSCSLTQSLCVKLALNWGWMTL